MWSPYHFNDMVSEEDVIQYIVNAFDGVGTERSSGDTFFFCELGGDLSADHRFPFATLVTGDHYDSASNLERPSVFRLNIGLSPETYKSCFDPRERPEDSVTMEDEELDFSTQD